MLLSGLDEKTPPQYSGPVETLVYCTARELTQLGHDVTVFATEDSADAFDFCAFKAYPLTRGARHLGFSQNETDALKLQIMRGALQSAVALQPDIVHNNEYTGLIAWAECDAKRRPVRMVTTAHWPFDDAITSPAFRLARHNVLTISHAQERSARERHFDLLYRGTVHNCISYDRFLAPEAIKKTERLAWVGRLDPMKGVEEAIEIARLVDQPLVMAGKMDNHTKPYFDAVVKGLLAKNRGLVEFLGEVPPLEVSRLMASAQAFLMTTKFQEAFGLVVVEAFAAGTPVVATDRGAMPELIRNGMNGFVVPMRASEIDIPRFAAAVRACGSIDSETCRTYAERFRPARMAQGYERAYLTMAQEHRSQRMPTQQRR